MMDAPYSGSLVGAYRFAASRGTTGTGEPGAGRDKDVEGMINLQSSTIWPTLRKPALRAVASVDALKSLRALSHVINHVCVCFPSRNRFASDS